MAVITLPRLGLTMTKGTILKWHKNVGDKVSKGELLVEFETDKISMEIESTEDGTLLDILVAEGNDAAVAEPICVIGSGDEADGWLHDKKETLAEVLPEVQIEKEVLIESKAEQAQNSVSRIFISPLAKKIAKENDIDYTKIKGSRPNGRIVKKDIEKAISERNKKLDEQNSRKELAMEDKQVGRQEVKQEGKRVPMTNMRKTIANRLSMSKREIPHVYFKAQVDMSNLLKLKGEAGGVLSSTKGLKLSVTHMLIKACAHAISQNLGVNTSFDNDSILWHEKINIGVAVDVEDGLIVPVIKDAGSKSLAQLCSELGELANKAHSKSLSMEEITGGTFTLSNLGMHGIDEFSAIINPPESAILAVGAIKECPVAENGEVLIRPVMNLVLSVDHRVIDGALAAKFMADIKKLLENPLSILVF